MRLNRLLIASAHAGVLFAACSSPAAAQSPNSPATYVGGSSDQTVVFFETADALDAVDTDSDVDLYRRAGDAVDLISGPSLPGSPSSEQAVTFGGNTPDGAVAFFTTADRLTPSDVDEYQDVYKWTKSDGPSLVSVGCVEGNGPDYPAYYQGASADGSRVFFETVEPLCASDPDDPVAPQRDDLYQRVAEETTLISAVQDGGPPRQPSVFDPQGNVRFGATSASGERVYFTTWATLVAEDTDERPDVYEWDRGTLTLVSRPMPGGSQTDGYSQFLEYSEQSDVVLFTSLDPITADDSDPGTDGDRDLDLYRYHDGLSELVSAPGEGAYGDRWSVYPGDVQPGTPHMTPDASAIYFTTRESLVGGDADLNDAQPPYGAYDVYERSDGVTSQVSILDDTALGPDGESQFQGVSKDGSAVVFQSFARLTEADDADKRLDLYARIDGSIRLLTKGTQLDTNYRGISADGSKLYFTSGEDLLEEDEHRGGSDVYAVGTAPGSAYELVSASEVPTGQRRSKSAQSQGPELDTDLNASSEDGSRVTFTTSQALTIEDTDARFDVYQRVHGETRLLSEPSGASQPNRPETSIDSGPEMGAVGVSDSPRFTFSSPSSDASFQCRFDGVAWQPCSAQYVGQGVPNGRHTFEVRAVAAEGDHDLTPAFRTFTVGQPACGDGQDNDSDGAVDYPADPGCVSADDNSEYERDTTIAAFEVTAARKQKQSGKRIKVEAFAEAAEPVDVVARGSIEVGSKSFNLPEVSRSALAHERAKLILKPGTKRNEKKIAAVLKKTRNAKALIEVTLEDTLGNSQDEILVVKLK